MVSTHVTTLDRGGTYQQLNPKKICPTEDVYYLEHVSMHIQKCSIPKRKYSVLSNIY